MTPTVPNLGVIGVVGVTSFRIVLYIARMHVTDSSCYRRRHDVIITHNKYYFTMTYYTKSFHKRFIIRVEIRIFDIVSLTDFCV